MGIASITRYFDSFSEKQLQQFSELEALYTDWNEKINVISRKDIDSLYEKHVLHSLSLAAVFSFAPGMRVIDIGAGGGFPSLPLAIFFPETEFVAVDSIAKKLKVVEEIAKATGIENLSTRHSRAEALKGEWFDVAVSRAVAPLKDLLQWSKPLLRKPNGVEEKFFSPDTDARIPSGLICLKGGDLSKEIQESGKKPNIWKINQVFDEPFFQEKFILQVTT